MKRIACLLVVSLLIGCGGGGGGGGDSTPPVTSSAPQVSVTSATSVSGSGATLNGSVTPMGADTEAWFEWGADPALATYTSTTHQPSGSGTIASAVTQALSGCSGGTQYYFRVCASNVKGEVKSSITSFTTLKEGWTNYRKYFNYNNQFTLEYMHFDTIDTNKIYLTSSFGQNGILVVDYSKITATPLAIKAEYITIDPKNNNHLIAYCPNPFGTISESTDGGINWQTVAGTDNLLSLNNHYILYSTDGGMLFLFSNSASSQISSPGSNLSLSTNSGRTWFAPIGLRTQVGYGPLVTTPADSNRIYVREGGESLYRSTDRGLNWTKITSPPSGGMNGDIAADPYNANVVFSVSGNPLALYKSMDGGQNWNLVTLDLSDYTSGYSLNANPYVNGLMYFAVNRNFPMKTMIFRSKDGGVTWETLNDFPNVGLPGPYINRIISGPMGSDGSVIIYVAAGDLYRYVDYP